MFTKALNIIKGLLAGAGALAPILALFGVAVPPAAAAAIPATIGLMTAAEEALGDGTGPIKKEAVVAGMGAFTSVMQNVSTGGQKETWDKVTPEVISISIDTLSTVANNIAVELGHDPVVVSEMDPKTMGQ